MSYPYGKFISYPYGKIGYGNDVDDYAVGILLIAERFGEIGIDDY